MGERGDGGPAGSTLVVRGDGSLASDGADYGFGIGGGYRVSCGGIEI